MGYSTGELRYNNLITSRNLGDGSGGQLKVTQIGSAASSHAKGLGGSLWIREKRKSHIHRQEHHISLGDTLLHVGAEEQVDSAHLLHDLVETRLEDGQTLAVPLLHSLSVQIDHVDRDIGALESNNGHRGTTHITSADAANVLDPNRQERMELFTVSWKDNREKSEDWSVCITTLKRPIYSTMKLPG